MEFMVVGFMFDLQFRNVLLLKKAHPEWQRGLLNGVGGHVEDWENNTCEAQCREFLEETGIATRREDWKPIATLRGKGWRVWVHAAVAPYGTLAEAVQNTKDRDEKAEVAPVWTLGEHIEHYGHAVVGNVRWLVPLALDKLTNPAAPTGVVVDYDE